MTASPSLNGHKRPTMPVLGDWRPATPEPADKGAQVAAHDPVAQQVARRHFGDRLRYTETPYEAIEGAEALFLLTEWNDFRHPDFARMRATMKSPVIFDGRNVFDPARMRERGFVYFGIGR